MFLWPLGASVTQWTGGTDAPASTRRRVTIDRRRFTRMSSVFLLGWRWLVG